MTPECWQRVDEIFQAAIDLTAEERSAFVAHACGEDEDLRREVESLLTADKQGLSLVDEPALQVAAGLLTTSEPELAEGQSIGHYDIIGLIGRGGMGEVYLAKDKLLNRCVALKLLPAAYTSNHDRLQRFEREAQAASALNHPNILTIYELGQVGGQHFIATEFVEGETLRQRLKRAPLNLAEAIEIALQISSALAIAHDAGIIHRDIKPENIMLRPDGLVKVLDFGLAKLLRDEGGGMKDESEKETPIHPSPFRPHPSIASGFVMGTVKYMSPEQARGLEVDARSDIFSFGVVLYEMVTGHAPFAGETVSDLVVATQKQEPTPLAEFLPREAPELQRIISKVLRKDKVERYQTTQELLTDLGNLKDVFTTPTDSVPMRDSQVALTSMTKAIATVPSAEYLFRSIKDHKTGAAFMFASLMLAALAVSIELHKAFKMRSAHFENITVTKFTNFAGALLPSISPDGKHVVYAKPDTEYTGKFTLQVRTVGTTNEVQIVPATEGELYDTSFSPDGKYIGYSVKLGDHVTMFVVPMWGGNATKLPLKRVTHVSFSPDGKRLAYLHNRLSEGKTVLVVANSDGSNERDIFTRQAPNYYYTANKPSWSPDGKQIACVGQNGTESFPHIFVVDVETGMERPITSQKWSNMGNIAWLPDMSGLVAVASEETSCFMQIWHISYPRGEARRITHDTVNYFSLSLSGNGKALVATTVEAPTSIWTMPVDVIEPSGGRSTTFSVDTGKARSVNVTNFTGTSPFEGYARPSWTPDGKRIVYMSEESGNGDLWSMNADGSDRRQLTTDPHWDTAPVIAQNGRHIAFMSDRAGAENIWLMDIDGGNQRRLTNKLVERNPAFSADSRWVYFSSWETGKATIWKIPVEGGAPTQVITDLSFFPALSPDGKWLLYIATGKVFIAPAAGGAPLRSFDQRGFWYSWTADGRALTLLQPHPHDNGVSLWEQPLDGSEARQLTNFTPDNISKYAFSLDGKQLVVVREDYTSDVVMINDLK